MESLVVAAPGAPARGLLRYAADRRTFGVLVVNGLLTVAAWLWVPYGPWWLPAMAVLAYTSWLCAVVAHNTVHCPVFTRRWMNRAFQIEEFGVAGRDV